MEHHIAFGRGFTTEAHRKLYQGVVDAAKARKAGHTIILSRTVGPKDPLTPEQKVKHARRALSRDANVTTATAEKPSLFHHVVDLHSKGVKNLHIYGGSDRREMVDQIKKYNGKKGAHGYYKFDSITFHQQGEERKDAGKAVLDPSDESTYSGSNARKLVKSGDRKTFRRIAPSTMSPKHKDELFNDIHAGMKANPEKAKRTKKLAEAVTRKDFGPHLQSFVNFASDKLGVKSLPSIRFKDSNDSFSSFAAYNPGSKEVVIQTKNRHPMDIYRSVAHELVHHWQNENGKIGKDIEKEGSTGSPQENEANAVAGKIMRWFAKAVPNAFDAEAIVEKTAIFVVGGPCSGKDQVVKLITENNLAFKELDLQQLSYSTNDSNIIVNGSAHDFNNIRAANDLLKDLNYKTSMIFVDVENNISKMRNEQREARGQRMIAESIRFTKYSQARQNKEEFAKLFENLLVVDNSLDEACWKGYRSVKGKTPYSKGSCEKVAEENLHKWFQSKSPKTGASGWVQVGGKYDGYPCARQPGQTSTPKCRSSEERSKMSKKQKDYAFKKKNREDPNQPEKSGGAKPTMVSTYKKKKIMREDHEHEMVRNQLRTAMAAIQKLMKHVQGEGDLEAWVQSKITKAADYIDSVADYLGSQDSEVKEAKKVVKEAKDACYHKVKARYDVFPSAYASGALVKCRKVGAANWGSKANKKNVDEDFEKFMKNTYNREEGTKSLVNMYKKMTPGQFPDTIPTATANVYPTSLHEKEDCGCDHEKPKKKMKLKRKVLAQEDGVLDTASGAVGLPVSDSIGAEFGVAKSPSIITGLTGVSPMSQGAYMSVYPFGTYGIAESVINWMNKSSTQERYARKYGELAEKRLIETGITITESMKTSKNSKPKSFAQVREGIYGMPDESGRVPGSDRYKDGQFQEDSWSDKKYQNPEGGLTKAGVMKYRSENPGSKLQTAVRTPPSKLKKGGKRWKRRKSFCSRMKGMKAKLTSAKTARDPNSRINKSLRAWNCEE